MARLGNVIFLVFNCACDKGSCYASNQLHIKNFKKTTNFFLETLKSSVTKDVLGNAMNIFFGFVIIEGFYFSNFNKGQIWFKTKEVFLGLNNNIATKIINVFIQFEVERYNIGSIDLLNYNNGGCLMFGKLEKSGRFF